eukprot:TRINITY_DN57_c3_g4_i1.p1 TRINITY_DN57_c3_g4~~TRINITY_DN57_c3_g4_i1.p1  ORF type:complete len:580 (-),score=269.62 TRINITY_DN57_c3_g4_i1:55-1794(-)
MDSSSATTTETVVPSSPSSSFSSSSSLTETAAASSSSSTTSPNKNEKRKSDFGSRLYQDAMRKILTLEAVRELKKESEEKTLSQTYSFKPAITKYAQTKDRTIATLIQIADETAAKMAAVTKAHSPTSASSSSPRSNKNKTKNHKGKSKSEIPSSSLSTSSPLPSPKKEKKPLIPENDNLTKTGARLYEDAQAKEKRLAKKAEEMKKQETEGQKSPTITTQERDYFVSRMYAEGQQRNEKFAQQKKIKDQHEEQAFKTHLPKHYTPPSDHLVSYDPYRNHEILREQYDIRMREEASQSHMDATSRAILDALKAKKFREIFAQLDSDHDGYVDASVAESVSRILSELDAPFVLALIQQTSLANPRARWRLNEQQFCSELDLLITRHNRGAAFIVVPSPNSFSQERREKDREKLTKGLDASAMGSLSPLNTPPRSSSFTVLTPPPLTFSSPSSFASSSSSSSADPVSSSTSSSSSLPTKTTTSSASSPVLSNSTVSSSSSSSSVATTTVISSSSPSSLSSSSSASASTSSKPNVPALPLDAFKPAPSFSLDETAFTFNNKNKNSKSPSSSSSTTTAAAASS